MIVTPWQLSRRAELYHQLGSMLSAGIPLIQALESVASFHGPWRGGSAIADILAQLKAGHTFTESMDRTQDWIPEFDRALLSVGEKTGRLDASFRRLAVHYESRARIIRDTLAGLITTLATLHVFLLVFPLGLLTSFAQGLFQNDFAACAPFLIQKAVVFGVGYGLVFLIVFACQGDRGERWRAVMERVALGVPVLRTARKCLVLSRLSGALEALIGAGVLITDAWKIAADASGSPAVRRMVLGWGHQIQAGVAPGELVNQSSYFPPMFANVYNTGEQSGRLDESLRRAQAYFEEEGFRKLRLFSRLLNGTIYGGVVLLVAYNIIRFYAGYYAGLLN